MGEARLPGASRAGGVDRRDDPCLVREPSRKPLTEAEVAS